MKTRGMSIGPNEQYLLDHWGDRLNKALGETPYLVGSVMRAERWWRDVDVRMMLPAAIEDWATTWPTRLKAINLSFSLWGRQVTGLPIDFQLQPLEEFHSYDGQVRGALGIVTRAEDREQAGADLPVGEQP